MSNRSRSRGQTQITAPQATVPQGTIIQASLETAVDSTLPGPIRGVVSRTFTAWMDRRSLYRADQKSLASTAAASS
ncbi:hypothetical protein F1642_13700 [Paracoccus sp. NBH48]|nr:hypothetical protein [Paracoccus sp. NBH48]